MFIFVFFFKQTTAYDMGISDWSSDVCSSDLVVAIEGDHADLVGHRCIMPRREKAKPAWAPASRRVLSAGGRCSLGRTSCPDEGARHPWRACRGPRPPGHGSPRPPYPPLAFRNSQPPPGLKYGTTRREGTG